MKVVLWNVTKENQPMTGVKRYEDELYKHLRNLGIEVKRIRRSNNKILGSTFTSWMFKYWNKGADVVHATMETLAPVLEVRELENFVVTVHGLLPLISPSDTINDFTTKVTWRLIPRTLEKAKRIIAVSKFTKKELIEVLGIDRKKIIVYTMLIGGAIAGIAGMEEISGIHHRLRAAISPGYGYAGIPISLLAKGNILAIILSAILFGFLYVGGSALQTTYSIPIAVVLHLSIFSCTFL